MGDKWPPPRLRFLRRSALVCVIAGLLSSAVALAEWLFDRLEFLGPPKLAAVQGFRSAPSVRTLSRSHVSRVRRELHDHSPVLWMPRSQHVLPRRRDDAGLLPQRGHQHLLRRRLWAVGPDRAGAGSLEEDVELRDLRHRGV